MPQMAYLAIVVQTSPQVLNSGPAIYFLDDPERSKWNNYNSVVASVCVLWHKVRKLLKPCNKAKYIGVSYVSVGVRSVLRLLRPERLSRSRSVRALPETLPSFY